MNQTSFHVAGNIRYCTTLYKSEVRNRLSIDIITVPQRSLSITINRAVPDATRSSCFLTSRLLQLESVFYPQRPSGQKPWSQVSSASILPPGTCLHLLSRIGLLQHSHFSYFNARRFTSKFSKKLMLCPRAPPGCCC